VVLLVKTGKPGSKRDRGGASQEVLTMAKNFLIMAMVNSLLKRVWFSTRYGSWMIVPSFWGL